MKPPVRAGGGRRTDRYRGARRKRTRLPFAGVGKPECPRNPSAYKTPGSIEPPGEGARDEATRPGRRQAVLDPPQGAGRKWRAFGPPDMFSRAARPVGPPRGFCWRPGPRQWPAASRRLCGSRAGDVAFLLAGLGDGLDLGVARDEETAQVAGGHESFGDPAERSPVVE